MQLKPTWQRYIASPKANHLADWSIRSYLGTPSFIGLGCSTHPSVHSPSHQTFKTYEPPHDKTNKLGCAPSEDSDQPGHPPSLIRVFTVRMKKAWVLSYPLSAQRRHWSDWADAQDDLSLRWAHMPFCWFVTMRLMCVPFKSYLIKNINTVSIFTTDHCSVESTSVISFNVFRRPLR